MRNYLIITGILLAALLTSCRTPETNEQAAFEWLVKEDLFAILKRIENGQERFAVRTTATARSGTFVMEIILNRDLTVQDTRILSYPLSRGRGVLQPEFLHQFRRKTPADPIRVGGDIHAVTGATLSSTAAADAVRRALAFASRNKDRILR